MASTVMNMWFWESDDQSWNPFSDEMGHQLTTLKAQGSISVDVMIVNQMYRIDFAKNTQTNLSSRKVRSIHQGIPDVPPSVQSLLSSSFFYGNGSDDGNLKAFN
jgi:hypothetical protein